MYSDGMVDDPQPSALLYHQSKDSQISPAQLRLFLRAKQQLLIQINSETPDYRYSSNQPL